MRKLIVIITAALFAVHSGQGQPVRITQNIRGTPKSDVFLQAFYWNSTPGGLWWDSLAKLAPRLASAGIGAVWFPAPTKGAAGSLSMGYDIYDHYDFGEFNQKGSVKTRFGSRQELINSINTFHANGIRVFADAVMGHMNGAEQKVPYECKPYPSYPDSGWLVFNYPSGSGRFRKNASHFYPNLQTCDVNPPYHGPSDPLFKFGEIPAHAQSKVKDSLIVWGKYLRNVLGFDGFRIDEAKSIDPIFVGPWLAAADSGGYAVAEDYTDISGIQDWLYWCGQFGTKPAAFDFPLRFSLKDMCDNTSGSYDMNNLDYAGLVNNGTSGYNVATFADNHDFDRIGWDGSIDIGHNPIVNDKMMAYAYIIFSEGRPCIWFRDYFMYGLSGKIDTLIWIRQNFIYGSTTKRGGLNPSYYRNDISQLEQSMDIYVARRNGGNGRPAVYIVLNDNPTEWRGVWVDSDYPNQIFRDYTGSGMDKTAASDGRVDLWAPPRGYAVYVPDTSVRINRPPYVVGIKNQAAYLNTPYFYQISYGDPDHDSLSVSLSGNPPWLSLSDSGRIWGTPGDTGTSSVTVYAADPRGDTAAATFTLTVYSHPVIDGSFEGTGVWGPAVDVADTLAGWAGARAKDVYVTCDSSYFYFGANVTASAWMNWAFLINTKPGGGTSESWSRNILYNHFDPPDFILRGTFGNYAEFHSWNGFGWNGIGSPLNAAEFGHNLTSDTLQDTWVEARIPRILLGNPPVLGVQFYITGNQNSEATFDACPNDTNTTVWSGVTTRLRHYAIKGTKLLSRCNLQFPPSAILPVSGSVIIYSRVYGVGITDTTGSSSGVQAWIGYSQVNSNPSNWSSWIPAVYNMDYSSFDEYQASIGALLPEGIYYYASRFQYDGGSYLYGGYSSNGGGTWDSTHYISGVLKVFGIPSAPSLESPPDSSAQQPASPTLVWNQVWNAQAYWLQVATDKAFTHIVFNDSAITLTSKRIGPLPSDIKHYWRVKSKNIAGSSAFSDPWSFTVNEVNRNYYVNGSWNMVSLPLNVYDTRRSTVFSSAISSAFRYDPAFGYSQVDSMEPGIGYWLKFSQPESVVISGFSLLLDTISVKEGWNLIGSISSVVPTNAILEIPAGIIRSEYYSYNSSYVAATAIEPSKSYWVKADKGGELVLYKAAFLNISDNDPRLDPYRQSNVLTVEDAAKNRCKLYFAEKSSFAFDSSRFEMPPLPPAGVFDVRFASERMLETFIKDRAKEIPVKISSAEYPVKLTSAFSSRDAAAWLKINGRCIRLREGCAVEIADSSQVVLIMGGPYDLPESFQLDQNFPNPFNPTTVIRYGLPFASNVSLRIYSLLGEEIIVLSGGIQEAGFKEIEWKGEDMIGKGVSSGVYFLRMEAAAANDPARTFIAVRKLLLVR